MAGVEGEGKGKKPAREVREREGWGPFDPFIPFLRLATQAICTPGKIALFL